MCLFVKNNQTTPIGLTPLSLLARYGAKLKTPDEFESVDSSPTACSIPQNHSALHYSEYPRGFATKTTQRHISLIFIALRFL